MQAIKSAVVIGLLLGNSTLWASEPIFTYNGKKYTRDDFPIANQNQFYELENEFYERAQGVVDEVIVDLHIGEQIKKTGKNRDAIEADLFKTKDPTEQEIKDWYEANKNRIPYPLDKIKNDIKNLLVAEQKRDQKKTLVEKLKKDGKFSGQMMAPTAPIIKVNYAGHPMKGNDKAKVVMVEFADYQCPHCKAASSDVKAVMEKYKDKVAFYYVDFPINRSGISTTVAEGGYCAMQQDLGKYWEYHYKAFEEQNKLTVEWPVEAAKGLGLDTAKFEACLKDKAAKEFVAQGKAEGDRVGVGGTPTIFINGKKIRGHDVNSLSEEIDKALKEAGA